jgi:hypothetical protein
MIDMGVGQDHRVNLPWWNLEFIPVPGAQITFLKEPAINQQAAIVSPKNKP